MYGTLLAIALAAAPAVFNDRGETIAAPLSERVVTYEIKANLDPDANVLTGSESLTWLNRSAVPQHTLWFHLYWNAFKNDRSTFYMDSRRMGGVRDESSASASYPDRKKDEWGYLDITEMGVHDGP